jgi:hypothetical protein
MRTLLLFPLKGLFLLLLAALPGAAQQEQRPAPERVQPGRGNVPNRPRTPADLKAARVERVPGSFVALPVVGTWRQELICSADTPADVTGYRVVCPQASFLDFQSSDCCISGDHWQLKGKAWDLYPNTAVTTSPGPDSVYGLPARVYNYGGTASNPKGLDVYLECTYLHGVNVFPAGSYILVSSDGSCTVTPDPIRRRIDRTP